MVDQQRQVNEMVVISTIYDENEFFYKTNDKIECWINIFPNLIEQKLQVKYAEITVHNGSIVPYEMFFVEYLPPFRLYIQLPSNYPSEEPPAYHLSVSWLPPWEISYLCQKLDDLWELNEGNEILFLWIEFLKNDVFSHLNIQNSLDISFMYMAYVTPIEYLESNLPRICDSRVTNSALFLDPHQFLVNYSKSQHIAQFKTKSHLCTICLEQHLGKNCMEISQCQHVYCKDCMKQYISTKVKDGIIKIILCPELNCMCQLDITYIKELCPMLYPRYEELMLRVTLNSIPDIVYCPRNRCQYPTSREFDDNLAICANCNYSFCIYCLKVYHGIEPCTMAPADAAKLIRDYQNGDLNSKKSLEKKYGRRQIQRIVEEHLSKQYLLDNAKSCPNCHTMITKIDGCNKMSCIHCNASFCWLCGAHITTKNAYKHFNQTGTCFGRLFEGAIFGEADLLNNVNVVQNIIWFNQ